MFEVHKFKDIDSIVAPKAPEYYLAQEGLYLHKDTLVGEVLIPQDKLPAHHFGKMGEYKNGFLRFNDEMKVPAYIVRQAHAFFKEVFETRGTEAEVILLYNPDTKDWELFIPWQYATSASVDSIYDVRDIPEGYIAVGTIHSHCDFGAFHSGTDERDASGFNGIHLTEGHVNAEFPDFAGMVMINGVAWEYKNIERIAEINTQPIDIPDEWFSYVTTPEKIKDALLAQGFTRVEEWYKDVTRPAAVYTWLGDNKKKDDKKQVSAVVPYSNGKGNESYGWSWDKRFSSEVDAFVPAEFIDSSTFGKLKPEFVEEAFIFQLKKLRDNALKFGYEIWFEVTEMGDKSEAAKRASKEFWDEYEGYENGYSQYSEYGWGE